MIVKFYSGGSYTTSNQTRTEKVVWHDYKHIVSSSLIRGFKGTYIQGR